MISTASDNVVDVNVSGLLDERTASSRPAENCSICRRAQADGSGLLRQQVFLAPKEKAHGITQGQNETPSLPHLSHMGASYHR